MAHWLVTQKDRQFTTKDLEELKQLAREGKVGRGDLIQPPGASDWLYAVELPEIVGLLKAKKRDDDEDDAPKSKTLPLVALAVVFLIISAAGGGTIWHYYNLLKGVNLDIMKDLSLTEMLVTGDSATITAEPGTGAALGTAKQNEKVQLLSKRGGFYRIETESGAQGWIAVDQVVPAYFFADAETKKDYDPIYNPDRYVFVRNAGWMQLPEGQGSKKKNITIFSFMMPNSSKFDMENIVLNATIKDKNGKVLEEREVRIEGLVKRYDSTMVGTLLPDPKDKQGERRLLTSTSFADLSAADPDLQLRWSEGIEVQLDTPGFEVANIDLLEVRAVPAKIK